METCVASLEGAGHGLAFASGLAAEDNVLRLLNAGDRVLLGNDAYGGTFRLISKVHTGLTWTAVDLHRHRSPRRRMARRHQAGVAGDADQSRCCAASTSRRSARSPTTAARWCASTTRSPRRSCSSRWRSGADIVVHSATKYLGGHSDVVGGFLALDDDELAERLTFTQNAAGAVPAPFDCYLVLRGVKTLAVRMERHCANARSIVDLLVGHPAVERVLYPQLPDHPGHAAAAKQMRDFGGMVSFTMRGGSEAALQVAAATELFVLAESLGAVESLIEHPAPDDPRLGRRVAAGGARQPVAAVGRDRVRRRPGRRPRASPRVTARPRRRRRRRVRAG